jgi:hypothetical protein
MAGRRIDVISHADDGRIKGDLDIGARLRFARPVERSSGGAYGAAVATGIGVLALAVSAYTAYMQRQQVRAQVWPILEYNTGNDPEIRLWIANKGVGPALIRRVVVSLDGKPVKTWAEMLRALYGPGQYRFQEDTISGRVFSAGETLSVFVPKFDESQRALAARFDRDRFRVGIDLCYCSTLGDCWRLVSTPPNPSHTDDVPRCPPSDESSFRE